MTADLSNGFPPLADPDTAVPFEPEDDEEGAPSEAVAAVLEFCQDQGFTSPEYQELGLFAIAAIAGPLGEALNEGLNADEPLDGIDAADIQDTLTRLQIAAETLAAVDFGDEEELEEAEDGALEAEAA